jgi:hypothetical protein
MMEKSNEFTEEKSKVRYWLASMTDSPVSYLTLVLIEFYVLMTLTTEARGAITSRLDDVSAALLLLVLLVLFQEVILHDVRRERGYVLHLARRAAVKRNKLRPDFSANLWVLRMHLRALRRVADDRSGRIFEDLTVSLLRDEDQTIPDKMGLGEINFAIALDVARRASILPPVKVNEPFSEYYQCIRKVLASDAVTASDISQFLIRQYRGSSLGVRKEAQESPRKSVLRRIEDHVTVLQLFAVSLTAIVGFALGVISH